MISPQLFLDIHPDRYLDFFGHSSFRVPLLLAGRADWKRPLRLRFVTVTCAATSLVEISAGGDVRKLAKKAAVFFWDNGRIGFKELIARRGAKRACCLTPTR